MKVFTMSLVVLSFAFTFPVAAANLSAAEKKIAQNYDLSPRQVSNMKRICKTELNMKCLNIFKNAQNITATEDVTATKDVVGGSCKTNCTILDFGLKKIKGKWHGSFCLPC